MILSTIEKLGNWNPQVLREWKGRLTRRNVLLTAVVSLGIQLLTLLAFGGSLPDNELAQAYSHYCTGAAEYEYSSNYLCIRNATGDFTVNWELWWLEISRVFTYLLPLGLPVAGVYLLVGDMTRERQRGTLNFIRLSPRSGFNILLGKVLGVPALPYLAVLLTVPLQVVSALAGGISFPIVIGFYVLLAAICGVWFSAALLYSFLGISYAWLATLVTFSTMQTYLAIMGSLFRWNPFDFASNVDFFRWYFLPFGSNLVVLGGVTLAGAVFCTYWLWRMLYRRFHTPNSTILGKKQSYFATLGYALFLLGYIFHVPFLSQNDVNFYWYPANGLVTFFNVSWLVCLIIALSPHRPTLQDWARYRWSRSVKPVRHHSLLKDLLWGENSPAPFAVGVNAAIAALPVMAWGFLLPDATETLSVEIAAVSTVGLVILYAVVTQLVLFLPFQRHVLWATMTLVTLLFAPPVIAFFLQEVLGLPSQYTLVVISPLPYMSGGSFTSLIGFSYGILVQWLAIALVSLQLAHLLKQAGRSESQSLFTEAPKP